MGSGVARAFEPRFLDVRPFALGALLVTDPLALLLLLQIPPILLPSIERDLRCDEVQARN